MATLDDVDDWEDVSSPEEKQELERAQRNRPETSGSGTRADGGAVIARAHGGRVNPENINHNPTAAQIEAGNYKKDKIYLHGLCFVIETAKGKPRSGVGKNGKRWKVAMPCHYGYILRK